MPTVFTGVTQEMTIYREEIFGPVACIAKPFKTEAEVIAAANDYTFGLGKEGSVLGILEYTQLKVVSVNVAQ